MLTPMSIMSLDQGKEFARQEMKWLHAEPCEPTREAASPEARSAEDVHAAKWRQVIADFITARVVGSVLGIRRFEHMAPTPCETL